MSTALRCDDCGAVEVEPQRAARWFRLDRYGEGAIEEPRIPGDLPEMRMMVGGIHIDVHEGDPDLDDPEPSVDDLLPVTNHFCSARCLASFASTLVALDG